MRLCQIPVHGPQYLACVVVRLGWQTHIGNEYEPFLMREISKNK